MGELLSEEDWAKYDAGVAAGRALDVGQFKHIYLVGRGFTLADLYFMPELVRVS